MRKLCYLLPLLLLVGSLKAQSDSISKKELWKKKMEENYDLYVRKVKYQKENLPWADIHFGLNNWVDNSFASPSGSETAETFRSWMWKFGFGAKYRFDKKPFVLQYGLGFSVNRIGLPENTILMKTNNGTELLTNPLGDIDRSQFVIAYLNIPLMFHLDLSPYGVDNGFTFGIGGEIGVRMNGYQRQIYTDNYGDRMNIKSKGNYNFNMFRYGLATQIGYKKLKLTAGYDINPVFSRGPEHNFVYLLLGIII
ncbi:MAG: outer membrane beta-barrel protein [Cryomorphaceae bacterium]|nr:outer membrane beta-barrel protein [Cryomorphaceae bacterium]